MLAIETGEGAAVAAAVAALVGVVVAVVWVAVVGWYLLSSFMAGSDNDGLD